MNPGAIERIKNKIGQIIDAVNLAYESLPNNLEDFISSGIIKDGIYKNLEYAIQNIIDVCAIINAELNLGIPQNEDSVIDHIENQKIFDKSVIEIIKNMKRFRNNLIHRYGDIDDKLAFKTLKEDSGDFEKVLGAFEEFLKNQRKINEKNNIKDKQKTNSKNSNKNNNKTYHL